MSVSSRVINNLDQIADLLVVLRDDDSLSDSDKAIVASLFNNVDRLQTKLEARSRS